MVGRGRLVALEGGEASGKSTQAALLATALGAELTREPGGTPLGRALRDLLLSTAGPAVDARAEALLVVADRAQHAAAVLEPALSAGRWVVSDRYAASTLAYQGYGRGLDVEQLRRLCSWASGGLWPDLTVLLDVPAGTAAARRARGPDRFEAEDPDFHVRVAKGYLALARAEPACWAVVDGSGPCEVVAAAVATVVADRLGRPGRG